MKLGMALAASLLLDAALAADGAIASSGACVVIQVQGMNLVAVPVLMRAEETAARVFREVGVAVHWVGGPLRRSEEKCLAVEAEFRSNSYSDPGVLAHAFPYKQGGTQIQVFLNRVMNCSSVRQNGALLGYVIAHELGHVLQGIGRHSSYGVMKASWSTTDYHEIFEQSLRFADGDAELIRLGLGKVRKMVAADAL